MEVAACPASVCRSCSASSVCQALESQKSQQQTTPVALDVLANGAAYDVLVLLQQRTISGIFPRLFTIQREIFLHCISLSTGTYCDLTL